MVGVVSPDGPSTTITDILDARKRIEDHIIPTPLRTYSALNDIIGAQVYVKHENLQLTGSFKVRGGINLISQLNQDSCAGVIGYSTGNHGQSIAHAARLFGLPATIVVPLHPNPRKAAAIRALGAELVEAGGRFDDTMEAAEELARAGGLTLVTAASEARLLAGVGTVALEMLTEQPKLDVLFVPVGSGTGAAAACLVRSALAPGCRVIAVQSAASPAAHDSWRAGHCVRSPDRSMAEGLATGTGFEMTQAVLRKELDDFVLVSDEQIASAVVRFAETTMTLAEAAGATALAGALACRDQVAGQRVGVVCTGGNITLHRFNWCQEADARSTSTQMSDAQPAPGRSDSIP